MGIYSMNKLVSALSVAGIAQATKLASKDQDLVQAYENDE